MVLARLTLLASQTEHVYVHLEVQGGRESDFARRLFVHHYRLFDRFDAPVDSLVGQAALWERQLTRRFGPLPNEVRERLSAASREQLEV